MTSPTINTLLDESYVYEYLPSFKRKISLFMNDIRYEGPYSEMEGIYIHMTSRTKWFKLWKTAHILLPLSTFELQKATLGYSKIYDMVFAYPNPIEHIGSTSKCKYKNMTLQVANINPKSLAEALR